MSAYPLLGMGEQKVGPKLMQKFWIKKRDKNLIQQLSFKSIE